MGGSRGSANILFLQPLTVGHLVLRGLLPSCFAFATDKLIVCLLTKMSQHMTKGTSDNSVVILPSCLFHIGNTQREQDLLNLPPPSCSPSPGSESLFQLRTKQAMGSQAG